MLSAGARDVPLVCRAQRHRCGGETLRRVCGRVGRIVSKQPAAVDETAVTSCAFATRQGLSWSRRMWRAGLNRCNRADTVADRRIGRKPEVWRGALPLRCRGLHGLRANSPAVGRRTSTGVRRLRVQERWEPTGRIHSMEWALADENKKKKAGRKNQTVGGPRSTARAITV